MKAQLYSARTASAKITPTRPGVRSSLSYSYQQESAATMKEAVNTDFPVHCRVTDTDHFLKIMFPVEDTLVDAIWKKVKVAHHPQSRWSAFPESVAKEDELYGAFVSVANAIHNAAEELCPHHPGENTARLGGSTTWVDYHSKSPNSVDKDIARIRPDCLLAHSLLHDRVQTLPPDDATGVIWWLQIVAALEMKRNDKEKWEGVVKQLIGYLRQILREQLDRRFVFGFTLGPRCMAVCLHDRSGVLLTSTPIDIHKSPKDFIRIIAAFAVLAPDKLGFDPSMKIYVQPNEVVESYRLTSETALDVFATDSYKKRWVITLNDGTQYLTVKVMSVARARVMRGRATLVWAVVRFVNGRPGTEVFVLKQSWRPETVKSEGELYNEAKGSDCSHLGRITLCEDAVIDDMVDRTGSFIRAGLSASLPPGDNQERGTKRARAESEEPFLHVASTNDDEIERITTPRKREYVSRVHTRVIMSTYGWPLKYFATLKELLSVFLNGVQGHAYLYENGLLHRDISAGNVIIAWWPDEGAGTLRSRGCLIDFDRSKMGNRNPKTLPHIRIRNPLTEEQIANRLFMVSDFLSEEVPLPVSVKPEVIPPAHDVTRDHHNYTIAAIKYSLAFPPAQENYTITTDRLGWRMVEQCFDFTTSMSAPDNGKDGLKGSRTGTPPYASAEILGRVKYGTISAEVEYHDAIHDIESFLWIMVNICLTRSGPGGARRDELTGEGTGHEMLRKVVYHVFDSDNDTLILNKQHLFATPSAFEQDIVGNFHPYFHSLKPLIRQWFGLLHLAYAHHELYEYHTLHQRVIAMLEKAVATAPFEDDDDNVAKILEKRQKEIAQLLLPSDTGSKSVAAHLDSSPTATISQTHSQQRVPTSPPESPMRKRPRK
ncbi:hypothetical protein BDZ89DRAFT_1111886 [Hymenopellis radicata]|nr:hypothetical protein BDZ89DRAFT_1111886 [Hymenopellis radicata]